MELYSPAVPNFFSVADADKRTSAVLFGRSAMLDGGVVFFLLSGLLFHFPLGRSVIIEHMLSYLFASSSVLGFLCRGDMGFTVLISPLF